MQQAIQKNDPNVLSNRNVFLVTALMILYHDRWRPIRICLEIKEGETCIGEIICMIINGYDDGRYLACLLLFIEYLQHVVYHAGKQKRHFRYVNLSKNIHGGNQ